MSERLPDAVDVAVGSSRKSPRPLSERAELPHSRETTPADDDAHSDEDGTGGVELVADVDVVDEVSSYEEEEEEDDAVPPWIRANFPSVKSERDVDELLSGGRATPRSATASPLCDECAARRVAVSCVDCALALCWRCADAIHIVRKRTGLSELRRVAGCSLTFRLRPTDTRACGTLRSPRDRRH